ncbi:DUF3576 domain-containing protein [Actibacterium sp. XHP0104]|nr:DUF3576 domain-containing protein [Actibacterium sp. XHP0104]
MRITAMALATASLTGCGGIGSGDSGLFGGRKQPTATTPEREAELELQRQNLAGYEDRNRETIWDLFNNADNPNTTVEVNRYLWQASLEVLSFLPVESIDPFSGVIVTGYGTPPGGGRAYRATVYVQDPSLDARALKLAMATKSGPVAASTVRAVEDAILTRARQLRVRDGKL